jgi:DNA-directed RNA polymerase specialized sigma24 family protein
MKPSEVAITETYLEVEKLIFDTVHRFIRLYGGDFEEYVAESNVVYMKVYEAFDPERGAFSTLLVTSIWNRLIDVSYDRSEAMKVHGASLDAAKDDGGSLAEMVADHRPANFNLEEFASDLTEDAKSVLRMVLKSPKEFGPHLSDMIEEVAMGKGGENRNWRSTIRNYLWEVGWSVERISKTFSEIGAALA